MNYISDENIEWKKVKYLKEPLEVTDEQAKWKYELVLPEPLASWDVFAVWEKERIASMEKHLKTGDTLFDIGTEQGWCNLVYAKMVNPENMVLIEPTFEFWANIRKTWEKNFVVPPMSCYWGLFDNVTRADFDKGFDIWGVAGNEQIIDRNKYQYIHNSSDDITHLRLDDFVNFTGIVPDAITMDTEGSEYLILQGAEKTLEKYHPKLWVSIHDELGIRDYSVKPEQTVEYLKGFGYRAEHLATDHEAHWVFLYDD